MDPFPTIFEIAPHDLPLEFQPMDFLSDRSAPVWYSNQKGQLSTPIQKFNNLFFRLSVYVDSSEIYDELSFPLEPRREGLFRLMFQNIGSGLKRQKI